MTHVVVATTILVAIAILVMWAVGRTLDRTVSNPIEALDAIIEYIIDRP